MAITDDDGNLFEARPGTPYGLFMSAGEVRKAAFGKVHNCGKNQVKIQETPLEVSVDVLYAVVNSAARAMSQKASHDGIMSIKEYVVKLEEAAESAASFDAGLRRKPYDGIAVANRLSALGDKVLRLGSAMSADPAFSYVWKVVQAVGYAAEDYGKLKESIKFSPKSINVSCLAETVEMARTLSNQLAAHRLISGLRLDSKGDHSLSRSSADGTAAKAYKPGTGRFGHLYVRMLKGPAVVKPDHKERMWC